MTGHWEQQARQGIASASRACWDEPPAHWAKGVDHCLARIEPQLPREGVVLDLGCGVGRLLHPLAERHPNLQFRGVDSSVTMIRHALAANNKKPNVRLFTTDGQSIPDKRKLPSIAFCYSVLMLQHVPNAVVAGYIGQLAARLDEQGSVLLQFVYGGDSGPLCHPRPVSVVCGLLAGQGLAFDVLAQDDVYPTWCWVKGWRS